MDKPRYKVLIVEDEVLTAIYVKEILERQSYEVVEILKSGEKIIKTISEKNPNVVLMDINLKGESSGIELTKLIKKRYDIPVIYMTCYSDDSTVDEAKTTNPDGYINKPLREDDLLVSIKLALHKYNTEKNKKSPKPSKLRKQEILAEAVRLISKDGINNFSMVGVAKELGLTTPALYRHFGNKNDFLEYVGKELRIISEQYFNGINTSNTNGINTLNYIIFEYCDFIENNNPLIYLLLSTCNFRSDDYLGELLSKIRNKNKNLIKDIIKDINTNKNNDDNEYERTAGLILYSIAELIENWQSSNEYLNLYHKIDNMQKILYKVIGIDK